MRNAYIEKRERKMREKGERKQRIKKKERKRESELFNLELRGGVKNLRSWKTPYWFPVW